MPFNGAGLFTRIHQWVNDAALGLNVDAARTDTDSNDIASGLTNCVTRDGQSPSFANLPMNGFKHTGLGIGSLATDSINYGQVFNSPSFTSPSATASPPADDNSFRLATTAWVNQIAFSTALPAQPGTATPLFLRTLSGVAAWSSISVGTHTIIVHTGNAMGSVNTKVRRFTTVLINTGTAITYADSATNGASFTINEAGLYSIIYNDKSSGSADVIATLNDTVGLIGNVLVGTATDTVAQNYQSSGVVRLSQGDIVRPLVTNSELSGLGIAVYFAIRKVGF